MEGGEEVEGGREALSGCEVKTEQQNKDKRRRQRADGGQYGDTPTDRQTAGTHRATNQTNPLRVP